LKSVHSAKKVEEKTTFQTLLISHYHGLTYPMAPGKEDALPPYQISLTCKNMTARSDSGAQAKEQRNNERRLESEKEWGI